MTSNSNAVSLYFNEYSAPSRKVLISLYEKKVDFEKKPVDLYNGEQFQTWFLEINPKGEVPVLTHGDNIVVESSKIMEYIDKNFGRSFLLYPVESKQKIDDLIQKMDSISMFVITYGMVCFQSEEFSRVLRHPYSSFDRKMLINKLNTKFSALNRVADSHKGSASESLLREKSSQLCEQLNLMRDKSLFQKYLYQVEEILDLVEADLQKEDRNGPWLCGPKFTAADVTLTAFLMRLYQLGLDDEMWKNGRRPHLSIYQELAFRRPSVERATQWREHEGNTKKLLRNNSGENNEAAIDAAMVGLGAVVLMGGIYVCKKLFRR